MGKVEANRSTLHPRKETVPGKERNLKTKKRWEIIKEVRGIAGYTSCSPYNSITTCSKAVGLFGLPAAFVLLFVDFLLCMEKQSDVVCTLA